MNYLHSSQVFSDFPIKLQIGKINIIKILTLLASLTKLIFTLQHIADTYI